MTHIFTKALTDDQYKSVTTFYQQFPALSIEQYAGYAQMRTEDEVIHYLLTDAQQKIRAYAQIIYRKFRIADIYYGPIAISPEIYGEALIHIKQFCFKNLIPVLRVFPPYIPTEDREEFFEKLKQAISFETSDIELNWATIMIDTTPSEEEILKSFADNHRQSVKKAIKMGLTVECISDASVIDIFSDQHTDMYESRNLPIDREKNRIHFKKLYTFFKKTGLGYFVVVKENDKIIGGVLCVIDGDAIRYSEGYSHPDFRKYPISHIAIYEAIKIAKQRGFHSFDMGGYNDNTKEGDQLYAINKFKDAFRGKHVSYPKTMLIYTIPLSKYLFSLYRKIKKG